MTQSRIFIAFLVLLCCGGLAVKTKGQSVTGYTEIDYYADSDTLDAYSETDLDDYLVGDYDAWITLTIRDQNGSVLSSSAARDNYGNGYISIETIVYGTVPGSTYTATAFHKAVADLWDYNSYYPYRIFYYDIYNFTYFEGQGISAPWYYHFLGPGPEVHRNTSPISVGSTYDSDSVSTPAGNPDHLRVVGDDTGVVATCTSTIARRITFKLWIRMAEILVRRQCRSFSVASQRIRVDLMVEVRLPAPALRRTAKDNLSTTLQ
jgi:hypothetical protein